VVDPIDDASPPESAPRRPIADARRPSKLDELTLIERVFENSENDYITVLAIAKRARMILDDYPEYMDILELERPTNIALREFLDKSFTFHFNPGKARGAK